MAARRFTVAVELAGGGGGGKMVSQITHRDSINHFWSQMQPPNCSLTTHLLFVQPPSNYSFRYISQWQISKPRAVKIRVWAYTVESGLKKKNKKTYHGCSVYELVKVHVHNFHQNFFHLISNPSGLDLSAAHSGRALCVRPSGFSTCERDPEGSLLGWLWSWNA